MGLSLVKGDRPNVKLPLIFFSHRDFCGMWSHSLTIVWGNSVRAKWLKQKPCGSQNLFRLNSFQIPRLDFPSWLLSLDNHLASIFHRLTQNIFHFKSPEEEKLNPLQSLFFALKWNEGEHPLFMPGHLAVHWHAVERLDFRSRSTSSFN